MLCLTWRGAGPRYSACSLVCRSPHEAASACTEPRICSLQLAQPQAHEPQSAAQVLHGGLLCYHSPPCPCNGRPCLAQINNLAPADAALQPEVPRGHARAAADSG